MFKPSVSRLLTFISLLILLGVLLAGAATASSAQFRLGFKHGDDWEPATSADRFGHIYTLYPHFSGIRGCQDCPVALLQISADRGQTWTWPRIVTPKDLGNEQIDTQIVVDPIDGKTVYAAWLQNHKSDVVVTKSTDFGQTWSDPVIADSAKAGVDKPILIDRGQDVYVGYDRSGKTWVASSHDGGKSFKQYEAPKNNKLGISLAGGAAIDSKGDVYFSRGGYTNDGKGPVNLFITKSTDGGKTWTVVVVDVSAGAPDCSRFNCGWAYLAAQIVMTVDAYDTLYTLWNAGQVDKGPERIYFARSTDYGATWRDRQDVSLAPIGVDHAFPAIVSGGAGDVRIAWMDARSSGKWNVFYRESTNSGLSWSPESELSTFVAGYPYISPEGFDFPYGDYFDLAVDDHGVTQLIWGEGPNYTGPGNVWYRSAPH